MGKYLNRIQIGAHYTRSQHPDTREFGLASRLVNNLLWYMIPSKLAYENISVLDINVNDQGVESSQEDPYIYHVLNGIVKCQYQNFDFAAFLDLPVINRNIAVLNLVRRALKEVLTSDTDQLQVLMSITDKIEESGFRYEVESKKLSKSNKALKLRAILVACVDQSGQNAFLRIKNVTDEVIFEAHLLTNIIYEFREQLHKTRWEGSHFIYTKRMAD